MGSVTSSLSFLTDIEMGLEVHPLPESIGVDSQTLVGPQGPIP